MAVILSHTFTAANGTALTSLTPEVGSTWAAHPNSSGVLSVLSNRIAQSSGSEPIYYNATVIFGPFTVNSPWT